MSPDRDCHRGGLVANEENLDSLKVHALVICLWPRRKRFGSACGTNRTVPCSRRQIRWRRSANCLPNGNRSTDVPTCRNGIALS